MTEKKKTEWRLYISLITGFAVGAEILTDSDGRNSYGLQLFLVRILFTREPLFLT